MVCVFPYMAVFLGWRELLEDGRAKNTSQFPVLMPPKMQVSTEPQSVLSSYQHVLC